MSVVGLRTDTHIPLPSFLPSFHPGNFSSERRTEPFWQRSFTSSVKEGRLSLTLPPLLLSSLPPSLRDRSFLTTYYMMQPPLAWQNSPLIPGIRNGPRKSGKFFVGTKARAQSLLPSSRSAATAALGSTAPHFSRPYSRDSHFLLLSCSSFLSE